MSAADPTALEDTLDLLSDPEAMADFVSTMDDLLLNRRFWKRIFEISGHDDQTSGEDVMARAEGIIAKAGCPYERISSANSLTRFRPRNSKDEPSRFKLRLIKKDDRQVPRVYPVEDFFSLNASTIRTQISRIYVPAGKGSDGRLWPEVVRGLLRVAL